MERSVVLQKKNIKKLLGFAACLLLGILAWNNWVQPNMLTASAAGNYTVDYSQYDWGTGATVTVTITNNNMSAINGWTLEWTFSGNQKITNMWNGNYTKRGTVVTVTNPSYSTTIPANGGQVSFGFNISYSGTNEKPTSFTLNGSASATASPSSTVSATPSVTTTVTSTATATPTSSSSIDDDWENNVGAITLGSTITHTGNGVSTNGSKISITDGGDFTVTGTLTNGQIYVNTTEKVKLRLSGVSITNSTGPAIYFYNTDKGFITLTSGTNNTLTDGGDYSDANAKGTVFSNDDLEIKGSGSLTLVGKYKHAIACDDDLTIENGNITITAAAKDGIHVNDTIEVNGGTVKITANSDCFQSENADMIVNDGTLTLAAGSDGVQVATDLTINGGTVNVTKAVEGLEAKANLIINGGTVNVVASEDGLNSRTSIKIAGGTTNLVVLRGDGADTAGSFTISGGSIAAYGSRQPEGSFDCDNNAVAVTGGTVIGMGGNTSNFNSNSSQCVLILSGASANQTVSIKNSSGREVCNFKVKQTGATFVFSSPLLALNTNYTLYVNGFQTRTFTTTSTVTVSGGSIFGGGWWWDRKKRSY
jgi:hypothetical protein